MESYDCLNCRINSKFCGILLLIVSLPITGCVTTLGYIPEYIKSDGKPATYEQARKWATDVLDGYDSRATMNRQALYGGSILAALGVSALTGLTLSNTRGTALSAVPLGFGFLGGIAALYQHDEKATIYSNASRSVKALITMSDDRINKFQQDKKRQEKKTADDKTEMDFYEIRIASQFNKDAESDLNNAKAAEKEFRESAVAARRDANDPNIKDDSVRKAKQDKANAADEQLNHAVANLKKAELAVRTAKASLENAKARSSGEIDSFKESEAICLQKDVNFLMSKVEDHLLFLDPKKVADTLRAVKAVDLTKSTNATETIKLPPIDYSDIDPTNVKSACP